MRSLRVGTDEIKVKASPSFLEKAICPAALKAQYIDNAEEEFSVPAARGNAAHDSIAELTSSTTITASTLPIRASRSVTVKSSKKTMGMTAANNKNSCRNAASYRRPAISPFME